VGYNPGGPCASRLTSPLYTVTHSGMVALAFRHCYSLEYYMGGRYDGGQLRLSANGASFATVPADRFVTNSYDGIIIGRNALEGQPGFNGDSPGYHIGSNILSVATLGPFNPGDRFCIQFLVAWDESGFGRLPNWAIDSVAFDPPVQRPGADAPVTFTVQATAALAGLTNAPLAYQWQRNDGAGFLDLPQENAPTYTLRPFLADNGAQFRCIVQTLGLSVTSQVATLTVTVEGGQTPLAITQSEGMRQFPGHFRRRAGAGADINAFRSAHPWSPVESSRYQTNAATISFTMAPAAGNRFFRLGQAP